MLLDYSNRNKVLTAITPQTQTNADTAIVGSIVDTAGAEGVTFDILWGTLTDADAVFAVTLAESADSGMAGANAVAATDLVGTLAGASVTFADDNKCTKLGYIGNKRYLQLTVTPTGNNSGAAPVAAGVTLANMRVQPQSTQKN
jgi:hypothetical protein